MPRHSVSVQPVRQQGPSQLASSASNSSSQQQLRLLLKLRVGKLTIGAAGAIADVSSGEGRRVFDDAGTLRHLSSRVLHQVRANSEQGMSVTIKALSDAPPIAAKARVGVVGATAADLRRREKINSSKNAERVLAGVTFYGFVFSVATWHWWLEHNVGLYVWVLCALATLASD